MKISLVIPVLPQQESLTSLKNDVRSHAPDVLFCFMCDGEVSILIFRPDGWNATEHVAICEQLSLDLLSVNDLERSI